MISRLSVKTTAISLLVAFVSMFFVATESMAAPKKAASAGNDPVVVIETPRGTIKVQIYKNDAPITAANFLDLVGKGFYNGLSFHRVEPNFCVQGGDPQGNGTGGYIDPATKARRTIPLETKPQLTHDTGVIAMARSSAPNSASCQFYFTLSPQHGLDGSYAVFGKVIEGMNVVQSIQIGDKMTKVYLAK